MNDTHQYLSALSAGQKAEKLRLELAQLQAAMAPLQAEMAPLKERMKAISTQLKTLTPAPHVHGPDCGAACNPLETKSLPPEEEVKIGEPVPLEAAAVDPEPSKERAPGDPVWIPKMVKRRVPADPIFCYTYPKELRKFCTGCKVEFKSRKYIDVTSKASPDKNLARKVTKASHLAYADMIQAMREAGEEIPVYPEKVKKVKKERVYGAKDYDGRCPICKRLVRIEVSVWVVEEESDEIVGYACSKMGLRDDRYNFSMWKVGAALLQAQDLYRGVRIYNTGYKTPEGHAEFLTPLIRMSPGSHSVPPWPGFDKMRQSIGKLEEWLKSDMNTSPYKNIPHYDLQFVSGLPPPAGGGGRPVPQIRSL